MGGGAKETGLSVPKETAAKLKLADREVPLYAYKGDIEMKVVDKKLYPVSMATDGTNHIYFVDDFSKKDIYRIDL